MMSEGSNISDETQPVKVQAEGTPSGDTSRLNIFQEKQPSDQEIPDWLIEFASATEQKVDLESQHGLVAIEEPESAPREPIAPLFLETAEWHDVQAELEQPKPASDKETASFEIKQSVHELLLTGDFAATADFIRKTATTKELAIESQLALRPHLVLQEDKLPLWTVYDELSEKIAQQEKLT